MFGSVQIVNANMKLFPVHLQPQDMQKSKHTRPQMPLGHILSLVHLVKVEVKQQTDTAAQRVYRINSNLSTAAALLKVQLTHLLPVSLPITFSNLTTSKTWSYCNMLYFFFKPCKDRISFKRGTGLSLVFHFTYVENKKNPPNQLNCTLENLH